MGSRISSRICIWYFSKESWCTVDLPLVEMAKGEAWNYFISSRYSSSSLKYAYHSEIL